VIADLDSGYRFNSSDLGPVAWDNPADPPGGGDNDGNGIVDDSHGADFVSTSANSPATDGDPTDDNLIDGGHGVHTAGTMGAAGNNSVGIAGVAQNVRIMPLRACGYFTDPTPTPVDESGTVCPVSSQILAINYAGLHGAKAANMSLGGTSFSATQRDAIAANPQVLFVISAGNDGEDNDSVPHYPCAYDPLAEGKSLVDNVICVAATDQADEPASFSDWGATSVDLGAPGTETLSTYPAIEVSFHESFEANDFATKWSQSGTNGFGRAKAGDGPLTSFGMSDSPEATPTPGSTYDTTLTTGVTIPAGSGACRLSGKRYRNGGSGATFYYQVLSDGSSAFFNNGTGATPTFEMTRFNTAPILGLAGHSVKLRFGFTAGSGTTATTGIWFDDLEITCYKPVSASPEYAFLQGTSMAAPHVTGAAGLLFSLEPSATVTEVREALLAGVDKIPSLTGKTVTGGRLDIAKAMDGLEGKAVDAVAPAKPVLSGTVPGSGTNDNNPMIKGSAEAGATVTLFKGTECAGAPVATGTAEELSGTGIGVTVADNSISFFSAGATDAARNKSTCSTPTSYLESTPPPEPKIIEGPPDAAEEKANRSGGEAPPPEGPPPGNPSCMVPKLTGKTLGQASVALAKAGCKLGKVGKPRAKKGHKPGPLVVKSSSPPAGAKPAGGTVALTLGPKPKPKRRHHHH
jgi:subtilisin family serine protease